MSKPPLKHLPHGNYARADHFEAEAATLKVQVADLLADKDRAAIASLAVVLERDALKEEVAQLKSIIECKTFTSGSVEALAAELAMQTARAERLTEAGNQVIDAKNERVAQLEAALERYAGHDPDCPCLIRRECLCGFGAALAPKEPT